MLEEAKPLFCRGLIHLFEAACPSVAIQVKILLLQLALKS